MGDNSTNEREEIHEIYAKLENNDPTLDILRLFSRNIDSEGCRRLSQALQGNTRVTSVNLGRFLLRYFLAGIFVNFESVSLEQNRR